MALSMRRIFSIVGVAALMVAMLAAMAAPAFAKATHLEGEARLGGEPCDAKGVITPSGNSNLQCKIQPEGGNSGGSDGGGAATEKATEEDPVTVPRNAKGDTVQTPKGHIVETPSGNRSVHGHYNPPNQA